MLVRIIPAAISDLQCSERQTFSVSLDDISGDTKMRLSTDYSFFTSHSYSCTLSQAVPGR